MGQLTSSMHSQVIIRFKKRTQTGETPIVEQVLLADDER
jgi:hypothetical protein